MAACTARLTHVRLCIARYDQAIELFEEIANSYVEKDLLKFSCKEFYLKVGQTQKAHIIKPDLACNPHSGFEMCFGFGSQHRCVLGGKLTHINLFVRSSAAYHQL